MERRNAKQRTETEWRTGLDGARVSVCVFVFVFLSVYVAIDKTTVNGIQAGNHRHRRHQHEGNTNNSTNSNGTWGQPESRRQQVWIKKIKRGRDLWTEAA